VIRRGPTVAAADSQDGNVAVRGDSRRHADAAAPDAMPRRRAAPWRTVLFGVLVAAIAAGISWALLGPSLLVVRHVQVTGNRLVSAAQIRGVAAIRLGEPLATLNAVAAADRVEQIAQVLSARVSRSWPDTIVITVQERTPALAVATIGGYQLVDEYGVTVLSARRDPAGMPLLTSPPLSLRGSPAVRAAVLVLHQLPRSLRRRVRSVSAPTASLVTLQLTDGITVVWGAPGQAPRKAAELALLMRTHARYFDVSDPTNVVTQG
jgi:cell division protein FtsQ